MPTVDDQLDARHVGLCATCEHARLVESSRGSRFVLCEVGLRDPQYPRYPILPVRRCLAYQPASAPPAAD